MFHGTSALGDGTPPSSAGFSERRQALQSARGGQGLGRGCWHAHGLRSCPWPCCSSANLNLTAGDKGVLRLRTGECDSWSESNAGTSADKLSGLSREKRENKAGVEDWHKNSVFFEMRLFLCNDFIFFFRGIHGHNGSPLTVVRALDWALCDLHSGQPWTTHAASLGSAGQDAV